MATYPVDDVKRKRVKGIFSEIKYVNIETAEIRDMWIETFAECDYLLVAHSKSALVFVQKEMVNDIFILYSGGNRPLYNKAWFKKNFTVGNIVDLDYYKLTKNIDVD